MAGYVYLIGSHIFKWYKIGKAKLPEVRITDIGILLPFKIEIIGVWKAENHSALETLLHEKYKQQRINGEWFNFRTEEIKGIFSYLPQNSRIFPNQAEVEAAFTKFRNIERDCPEGKIIRYSIKKLCSYQMTDEERQKITIAAIQKQKYKKALRESQLEFPFSHRFLKPWLKKISGETR
jgi:hypothetical protein